MKSETMTYLVVRPKGWMGLLGFMLLFMLISLTGCSSDEGDEPRVEGPDVERGVPFELYGFVADYQEPQMKQAATRDMTVWNPDGYTRYNGTDQKVCICFTQDGHDPEHDKMIGYFFYSGDKWRTDLEDIRTESYYLYGFTPHTTGVSCEISSSADASDHSSYSAGAVLKINNLPTVTSSDICVVVGAKNGHNNKVAKENPNEYEVVGLQPGDFEFQAVATSTSGPTGNEVYLLFDHIYAALLFQVSVNPKYNELRTIKLKELRLTTSSDDAPMKEKTNATVTLAANPEKPITEVVFAQTGSKTIDGSVYQAELGEKGITLPDTDNPEEFVSHFMPQGVTNLIVTSRYDVYDKTGKMIRDNCTAVNTLPISLFDRQDHAEGGKKYTIEMTINPTYLYVLSDPDLDNPTVTVSL